LQDDTTSTFATQIGLKWQTPVFNGGSQVIDYAVWYDNASDGAVFTKLDEFITTTSYIVIGLVQGKTYQFKV